MDFSNQNYGPDSPNPQEKINPANPKRSKLNKEEPRFKQRMSKRSGGPRTPEGKAKSSQNSVAHGGYITPSRISEEFCRFEQEVFGRLEPVGPIEAELVSQIASTLWRSKLMRRYVDNELDAIEFDDVSNRQLAVATEFPFEERYQFLLNVNEAENLRRQRFVKFWTTSCEKLSSEDCAEAVIVLADNRISEIFQETIQIMKQSFVQEWMHEKFFDSLDRVMLEANEGRNSLGIKLKELDDKTDLVNYWIYRNSLKISAARKRLREREAIRIMCDPNIARAQSTADYALIKQLQNYWLLKNSDMKTGRDLQPRIAKQTISHITLAP